MKEYRVKFSVLRARLLYRFTADKPCRLIKINEQPYLERYFLGEFAGITFFLHRFLASDGDRFVHDHPWRWSLALILCGRYQEERLCYLEPGKGWRSRYRHLKSGFVNFISAGTFHRIQHPQPETWTLFMHAKRVKDWGFLNYEASTGRIYYEAHRDPHESHGWKYHAPPGAEAGREPFSTSLTAE